MDCRVRVVLGFVAALGSPSLTGCSAPRTPPSRATAAVEATARDTPAADAGLEIARDDHDAGPVCSGDEPVLACPTWHDDPGDPAAEQRLAEVSAHRRAGAWDACVQSALDALTPATGSTRAWVIAREGVACVQSSRMARSRTRRAQEARPPWWGREAALFRVIACAGDEDRDDRVDAEYWLGREAYEHERNAEAAAWFGHVTRRHARHPTAVYAGALWLDTLNALRCYPELARAVSVERAIFCAPPPRVETVEHCQILERLGAQIERLDGGAP